ncbi:MAG TPA: response regulator [Opitutaceae bacterium]|jgi:DNA-binding response OmpR family regulator
MKAKPAQRRTGVPPVRSRGSTQSPRGRLLLVEDHEPTRNAVKKLLAARNFEVCAAGSVADAWALVEDTRFDFVVSDIGLPDGDGFLLMRELQERYGLRGIALTGFGLEDDVKLGKEAGFSAHIVKPIRADILDETLASLGL